MPGFAIFSDKDGKPIRVEEFTNYMVAFESLQNTKERVHIIAAKTREILAERRPEFRDVLFPPQPDPVVAVGVVEEDVKINPVYLRSQDMGCKGGSKKGGSKKPKK